MIKQKAIQLLKSNFKYLAFFYKYLKNKLFYIVFFSFFVSLLDALSLSMFIPLFDLASNASKSVSPDSGNGFRSFLDYFHISLTINNVLLLMLIFFTLKGVFRYLDVFFRARISAFFVKRLRISLLTRISALRYSKFISTDLGTIQNTVTVETTGAINAYTHYISVFQSAIFVMVYVTMSFYASPKFTVIVILGGWASRFLFHSFYSKSERISYAVSKKNNFFLSLVMQQVINFKYLKATAAMPVYVSKIKETINETENEQLKLGYISAKVLSVREPIIMLFLVAAIYIQINIVKGEIGAILLSLMFFYRALSSLMTVQTGWTAFLKYVGSIIHIQKFEESLDGANESLSGADFAGLQHEIALQDVAFGFTDGTRILNKVNHIIPRNRTTAIVGKSGSGKTTLVNLIIGLLQPDSGAILIDGINLNTYNPDSYRKSVGLISQETVVFTDTLYNNVTLWSEKSSANSAAFYEAIQKADLVDFINSCENGVDTVLGDGGIIMSGGQRQRLSIARELFRKTEILVLDEATSSLDSHTEKLIQQSIENIKGSVTIIIIAHRLSTIRNADQILVLKDGTIESSGDFAHLVAASETFAAMVTMQEI